MAVQPGNEHIGEEYTAQSHIDRCVEGRKRLGHSKPLKRLAAAQQFAVISQIASRISRARW